MKKSDRKLYYEISDKQDRIILLYRKLLNVDLLFDCNRLDDNSICIDFKSYRILGDCKNYKEKNYD